MRVFAFILGILLLLCAAGAVGYEFVTSPDGFAFMELGRMWFQIDAPSLNLMQAVVERYLFPALWHEVVFPVLNWPAVLVFGVPGLILVLVSRLRRRRR